MGGLKEDTQMKPITTYRQRRDLMLKKFSTKTISSVLEEEILRSGLLIVYKRGRPCEIRKEKIMGFLLFSKLMKDVYEQMELNSESYLGRHYDHGSFWYHYTAFPSVVIIRLTSILEVKIKSLIDEILLHIADSSALSTSVREERIRQGTRNNPISNSITEIFIYIYFSYPFQGLVLKKEVDCNGRRRVCSIQGYF